MDAPNMSDPFFTDIVAVFLGNACQINTMNNSVTFQKNGKFYYYFSLCSKRTDCHRRTNRRC